MTFEHLHLQIAELTGISQGELDPNGDLIDFGLDSIQILTLLEEWQELGIKVELADLFKELTLNGWWQVLAPKFEQDL